MLLQLSNIFKWVQTGGQRTFLLKDINLTVEKGEFISIMGPSGSGKTTLLNVIGMLDGFNEGTYNFMDQSVHQLKEKHRSALYKEYIGFVFQAYHLIDELTVYENIETPLLYKKFRPAERKALVADMLDRFNIVGKKIFPRTTERRPATTRRYSESPDFQAKTYPGRRTHREPQFPPGRRDHGTL